MTSGTAVVIGASRGLGRGIAMELGKAKYKVYCCGRSSLGGELTVEKTAEMVEKLGGEGVPVRLDANDDAALKTFAESLDSVDVLAYAAYQTPANQDPRTFRDPFWKQGAPMWDTVHGIGLRGAYMTLCSFAEKMNNESCVALISSFGGMSYTFNLAYGVGKAGLDRLAKDAAVELRPYNVDVVSLYPGVVRTEANLDLEKKGVWATASGGMNLSKGESPSFTGRALVELMKRPDYRRAHSGSIQVVAELAQEFDFLDPETFERPPSIRSLRFLVPSFLLTDEKLANKSGLERTFLTWFRDNVPDILLPWSVFSDGPPPPPPGSEEED